jgi:aspartate kinase
MQERNPFETLKVRRTEAMITVIGVPDVPGTAAGLFRSLAKGGISITMIVQNAPDAGSAAMTFTVARNDANAAMDIVRGRMVEVGAEGCMRDDNIARLSVWGKHLEETTGIAGDFFSILADSGINVLAINTTSDVVSCIIEDAHIDKAVQLIAQRFGLSVERID